jgi:long-chain acyl-CoA synthetase
MPEGTPTPRVSDIQIITTDELIELGASKSTSLSPVHPEPDDIAVIMYTSGSTGKPKGVVMRHSQLVAGVSGMQMNVNLISGKDVFVSYLPLAHVLALQIENAMLNNGTKICYSDPRQLAKTLSVFKPTIHAGVPKVWELLQTGLKKKIAASPTAVQVIFDINLRWKQRCLKAGLGTPITNVFFRLINKQVFGGVLRFGVSGGGPMNASLADFCTACFCCPIIQGYALTETCVGGCFQDMGDPRPGVVGPPVPCVEVALQSEPDIKDGAGLPYLFTDTISSKGEVIIGRGEIIMRGPCVSSGYYQMPEKTKEEFDEEGWFHTGDIGQFTEDGVVEIIDRKKNLVKLKGGEYVAVSKSNIINAFTAYLMFYIPLN